MVEKLWDYLHNQKLSCVFFFFLYVHISANDFVKQFLSHNDDTRSIILFYGRISSKLILLSNALKNMKI